MSSQTIGVPIERFNQLQALADRDGLTIVDVIGDFINSAIRDERIPATVPGWIVERVGNDIRFHVADEGIERRLTKAGALSLAVHLERCSLPAGRTGAVLDLDVDLKVERRGTAVRITDIRTGAQRATARSVAADVALLLRQAAA